MTLEVDGGKHLLQEEIFHIHHKFIRSFCRVFRWLKLLVKEVERYHQKFRAQ